ncbi:MAG: PDZ domain-containing protein [Gemmatimonadota bacterium]|nr:PDZ domain-containing protein [Gemmatimonadota bacterium]
MRSTMKGASRVALIATAVLPFAAASVRAQQDAGRIAPRPRAQICINDRCIDDTTRVVVLKLMDRLDSLQRVYLGSPIPPDERAQMAQEMSQMVSRLADIQRGALALSLGGLKRAAEEQNEAMARMGRDLGRYSVTLTVPPDVAPKGWIGITFAGWPEADTANGEYYVRYLSYPEVESVEPDSPAEHAGILRGDILLAFNGQDVTGRAISMTRLLQPDKRVIVRLDRDGETRDFPVVVGKAPRTFTVRINDFSAPPAPARAETPPPPAAPRIAVVEAAPAPARAPAPPRLFFYGFDSDVAPIAGAVMNSVDPDLGRALGVDRGVLVLRLSAGTPAADAGLRSGDVIVKAAGRPVTSVGDLRRTLERHSDDASVELQIVRDHKTRTLKLGND